jgi:hypothetical protein
VPYAPPQQILERYASVLVDYALGGGEGVKPGEVVRVTAPRAPARSTSSCAARCGERAAT